MTTENEAAPQTSAAVFALDGLLDLIVPFEYDYAGQTCAGRWYKYRTSTRTYVKTKAAERQRQVDEWNRLQKQIDALELNDPQIDELIAQCEALDEAAQRTNVSWLTDAIVEWNVVGRDRQPIPITPQGFADIPVPFLVSLAKYLTDSRTDDNPTSPDSQSF